jgi:hypothetical protein
MSKLDDFNKIWQEVNDSFNDTRKHPELNEISYLLADFRDYLGDVIDELELEEE